MLNAIFWDNDGVLVDTEMLYFQANRDTLKTIGIELSIDQFCTISLDQGQSVINLARYKGYNDNQLSNLRKMRNNQYLRLLKRGVRIMPGVEDTLRQLHGRVAMGIVTSASKASFDVIHRQTGLLPFFNLILTREDYSHSKPDPAPYLLALEHSGLKSGNCLAIEDTMRGLESAKAAGISCVIVTHAYNTQQHFPGAFKVIKKITELVPLVDTCSVKCSSKSS